MVGNEEQEVLTILRIGMETQYYLLKGTVKAVMKLLQYMGRLKDKKIIEGKQFDDFKTFISRTKGDYQIINIPTQDVRDIETLRNDLNKLGVTYHVLPDLNTSDGLTQIAYYAPHEQKIGTVIQNYIHAKLQYGGEKDFMKLQGLTGGDTSIVNIPWKETSAKLKKDLDHLHINYAIMPDLNVGDGYTQIVYANQDASKLKSWFELYQKDMISQGVSVDDIKSMTMEEYTQTGKITGQEYENTAPDEIKEQVAEYEKDHQKKPFEEALDAPGKRTHPIQDENYLKLKEQTGLKEITINKDTLVRGVNDTSGLVMVRLPGTYNGRGNREIDIALPQNELFLAADGQTYVGFIHLEKEYRTFNYTPNGDVMFKMSPQSENILGRNIYDEYFDPVDRKFRNVQKVEKDLTVPLDKSISKSAGETARKVTASVTIKPPQL